MNIAELLEKALEECNWEFVSDVYEMMTGKKIEPPVPDDVFNMVCDLGDRITKLESNLTNALNGVISNNTEVKKPMKKSRKKATVKKSENNKHDFAIKTNKPSRKVSGNNRKNKFEDMTDIIFEAEREQGYDKINDKIKPTSRDRKSYSTKAVKCVECNKNFDVHPMFVRDNYVCDRCIGRRG